MTSNIFLQQNKYQKRGCFVFKLTSCILEQITTNSFATRTNSMIRHFPLPVFDTLEKLEPLTKFTAEASQQISFKLWYLFNQQHQLNSSISRSFCQQLFEKFINQFQLDLSSVIHFNSVSRHTAKNHAVVKVIDARRIFKQRERYSETMRTCSCTKNVKKNGFVQLYSTFWLNFFNNSLLFYHTTLY